MPYSEFAKALSEGRIVDVLVSKRSVTGRLKVLDGNKTLGGLQLGV